MHPAHQVAAALHHECVAVVAQPGGHRESRAGPLVRGALCIAVNHQAAVVQVEPAFAELGLAESRAGCDDVATYLTFLEAGLDGVEVAVAPRPEVQSAHLLAGLGCGGGAGLERQGLAAEACHLTAVEVLHYGLQGEGVGHGVLVLHLALGVDGSLVPGNVEAGGVDVCSRRAEVGVEGQRLVELVGNVQIDILGQSAVVGVEVSVVPLVAAVEHSVAVLPRVVAAHGQHVLALNNKRCEVEAEGHHAVVRESHLLAVEPHVGTLTRTLKLDEHLSLQLFFGQGERLAIPADGVRQVYDVLSERLVAVESEGQRHLSPPCVVETGLTGFREVAHAETPALVEVKFLPFGSRCCEESRQQRNGQ